MKTAYAYARFSSDNQREESIDAQLRAIYDFCEKEHISVVRVFKDEAFSARSDKRPAFQQMFSLIEETPVDFVIVHKLDRFARNRFDAALYRSKLKEKGMKLVSVLERLDDSPESIILEGLLESMNEYYSANLSREARKGLKENMMQGKRNGGKAPLGYDSINQHLVPNGQAPIIRGLFKMYAEGKPYKELMEFSGYPRENIRNILLNEVYLGHLIFGEWRTENAHEALVDKETWDLCRRRMSSGNANAANRAKHNYLLSRLLICGKCGKPMIGLPSGNYFYYACRTKGCKFHHQEELEKRVVNELSKHLYPSDALKARIFDLACGRVNNQEEIEKAKKAKYILSQRISKLLASVQYADMEDVPIIMGQIKELRKQMPVIPEPITQFTREETDAFCDEFFDLKKKTREEQKIILHKALCKIVVYDDHFNLFTTLQGEVYFSVNKDGVF